MGRIQSQRQIVSLMVRRGARDRALDVNIEAAREIRAEALSGERNAKASAQALYISSAVADVVREQLGLTLTQVMSDEFSEIQDWLSGAEDVVPFPYLEALLIMAGHPAALAK